MIFSTDPTSTVAMNEVPLGRQGTLGLHEMSVSRQQQMRKSTMFFSHTHNRRCVILLGETRLPIDLQNNGKNQRPYTVNNLRNHLYKTCQVIIMSTLPIERERYIHKLNLANLKTYPFFLPASN